MTGLGNQGQLSRRFLFACGALVWAGQVIEHLAEPGPAADRAGKREFFTVGAQAFAAGEHCSARTGSCQAHIVFNGFRVVDIDPVNL